MRQIGGAYTAFCQEEGILLQKHRDRNGRCIAIILKVSGSGVDLRCVVAQASRLSFPATEPPDPRRFLKGF